MAVQSQGSANPVFIVLATVTEGIEDQWNDWYDNVHVPEVVAGGRGIVKAQRYRLWHGDGTAPYLAIYTFETQDALGAFITSEEISGMANSYRGRWGSNSDFSWGAFVPHEPADTSDGGPPPRTRSDT